MINIRMLIALALIDVPSCLAMESSLPRGISSHYDFARQCIEAFEKKDHPLQNLVIARCTWIEHTFSDPSLKITLAWQLKDSLEKADIERVHAGAYCYRDDIHSSLEQDERARAGVLLLFDSIAEENRLVDFMGRDELQDKINKAFRRYDRFRELQELQRQLDSAYLSKLMHKIRKDVACGDDKPTESKCEGTSPVHLLARASSAFDNSYDCIEDALSDAEEASDVM